MTRATALPTLLIPALPPKHLAANASLKGMDGFYAKVRRSKAKAATLADDLGPLVNVWMRDLGGPLTQPIRFHWTLYVDSWRCLDDDNFISALKVWRDYIIKVTGLVPNDGPRWVRGSTVTLVKDRRRAPATTLSIEPLEG